MDNRFDENIKIGFFTASILKWKSLLMPDKYKDIIINSLRFLDQNKRAAIYAFVLMPNHIHLLWRIVPPWRLSEVQRDFMKFTGQMLKSDLKKNNPALLKEFYVGLKDREYQFWQRSPLNKLIESREIVEQKLDYIHNNPSQGRWMLVKNPLHYNYSSMRFYEENERSFDFLTHYMEVFE